MQKKIKRFDQKSFLDKFKKSSEAKKAAYQGLINFITSNYEHHEKDLTQILAEAKTKIVVHDIKNNTDILLNKKDLKKGDHLCYSLKARLKIDIDNETKNQIISFENNIAQAASFDEIICWNRSGGKDDRTVTSRNEIYESHAKVGEQIYRIYDIEDQINALRQVDKNKNDFEKYSTLGKWAFDHQRYSQALDYFNKFMDMAKNENEDHLQPDKYENAIKAYQHALTLSNLTDKNIEKYKNNLKKAKVLCYFSRLADDKRFFEKTKPELKTIYQAIEMLVEYNIWDGTIDGKKKFEDFDFLDKNNKEFLSKFDSKYFDILIPNFQLNKNYFDIKKSFIQLDFYKYEKTLFLNTHSDYKNFYTPFHFFYRNYTPQEKLDAVDLLKDTIMFANSNINLINDFFDDISNKSALNAMTHGHLGKIAKPLVSYLKDKKSAFDTHKHQI